MSIGNISSIPGCRTFCVVVFVLFAFGIRQAAAQYNGIIGVQFSGQTLAKAGVYPQTNWNSGTGATGSVASAVDCAGVATGVRISWSGGSNYAAVGYQGSGTLTPTQTLLSKYIYGGTPQVSFGNLAPGTYNVVVYVTGNQINANTQQVDAGGVTFNTGSLCTYGGPSSYYYITPYAHLSGDSTAFIRAISTYNPVAGPGNIYPGSPSRNANYVEFDGVQITGAGGGFTVSQSGISVPNTTSGQSGIAAVQVIPTPRSIFYGLKMAPSDSAGALSPSAVAGPTSGTPALTYAQSHWNNLPAGASTTGTLTHLVDNNGNQSFISASWTGTNFYYSAGSGATGLTPDQLLYNYYLDDNTSLGPPGASVTFSNVPVGTYQVVVYLVSDVENRPSKLTLSTGSPSNIAATVPNTGPSTYLLTNSQYYGQVAPSINTTPPNAPPVTYYYSTINSGTATPVAYTQATSTNSGSTPQANYVVYNNVTVTQGTDAITVSQSGYTGLPSGIAAVQLIWSPLVAYPMAAENLGGLPAPSGTYSAQAWTKAYPTGTYTLDAYTPDDTNQFAYYQVTTSMDSSVFPNMNANGAAMNVPVPVYTGFIFNRAAPIVSNYDYENAHMVSPVSYASIDTDRPVVVTVTLTGSTNMANSTSVTFRPGGAVSGLSANPLPLTGRTFSFVVSNHPCQISIEPNGLDPSNPAAQHPLLLFVNGIDHDAPNPMDPSVQVVPPGSYPPVAPLTSTSTLTASTQTLYFPPGFYLTPPIALTTGQTCYLAGGAVVEPYPTYFSATGTDTLPNTLFNFPAEWTVHDLVLRGRGTASARMDLKCYGKNTHIWDYFHTGDTLEDLISRDCGNAPFWAFFTHWVTSYGNSSCDSGHNITVANHKTIAAGQNTDGVRVEECHDVEVQNCFSLNADDNYEIKTPWGSAFNVTFENCVAWTTVGGSFGFMGESNDAAEEPYFSAQYITFQNSDVIHSQSASYDRPIIGCTLYNSFSGVQNWLFRDLTIEDMNAYVDPSDDYYDYANPIYLDAPATNLDFEAINFYNIAMPPISNPYYSSDIYNYINMSTVYSDIMGTEAVPLEFQNITAGGTPLTPDGICIHDAPGSPIYYNLQ